MKKAFFLVSIFCFWGIMHVSAQNWGVRGSMNVSNLSTEMKAGKGVSVSDEEGMNGKVGARIGIVVNGDRPGKFNFQSGLYLSMLGAKNKAEQGGSKIKEVDNLLYLQMPVLGCLSFPLKNPDSKWQFMFGPYFGYGVSGKSKLTQDGKTVKVDLFKKVDNDFGARGGALLNRFDFGLSVGTGFLLRKVYLGMSYDFGLVNIVNKDVQEDLVVKNKNFSINMGVNF